MLASSKLKCSETLAFPNAYYKSIPNLGKSVELFCAYDRNHYYGDFGRYIFQRYFDYWKELRAGDLMRIAIKDIFQRGYDAYDFWLYVK